MSTSTPHSTGADSAAGHAPVAAVRPRKHSATQDRDRPPINMRKRSSKPNSAPGGRRRIAITPVQSMDAEKAEEGISSASKRPTRQDLRAEISTTRDQGRDEFLSDNDTDSDMSDREDDEQHRLDQQDGDDREGLNTMAASSGKPKRLRMKRGKYKPRRYDWFEYFKSRQPTTVNDGTVIVDNRIGDARGVMSEEIWRRFAAMRKNPPRVFATLADAGVVEPGDQEGGPHSIHNMDGNSSGLIVESDQEVEVPALRAPPPSPASPDLSDMDIDYDNQLNVNGGQEQGVSSKHPAPKPPKKQRKRVRPTPLTRLAKREFEQELDSGLWDEWVLDPPTVEYPYLQEAFPYQEYRPPSNRIKTESLGDINQPMDPHWYIPQGAVAADDFFSQDKYKYARTMLQKIKVDSDSLRMDLYYHRGFELASRRMLDRVRVKNRCDEKEAKRAQREKTTDTETNETIALNQDPQREYHVPSWPGQLQPAGGLPSSSARGASEPSLPDGGAGIQNTSATTATEASQPGLGLGPTEKNLRMDPNTEVTLTDYYQVNTFLSSLFVPSIQPNAEAPLSPGACRILQSLLMRLERRLMTTGCHLQRQELTKRLGQVDFEEASIRVAKRATRKADGKEGRQLSKEQEENASLLSAAAQVVQPSSSSGAIPVPSLADRRRGPKAFKPRGPSLTPYLRLKKFDMDDFVIKKSRGIIALEGAMRRQELALRGQSVPVSMTAFSAMGGDDGTPSRADSEARQGERDGGDEADQDEGDLHSGRPFVSNPLRIPLSMNPFLKSQDFEIAGGENTLLVQRLATAASESSGVVGTVSVAQRAGLSQTSQTLQVLQVLSSEGTGACSAAGTGGSTLTGPNAPIRPGREGGSDGS